MEESGLLFFETSIREWEELEQNENKVVTAKFILTPFSQSPHNTLWKATSL